MIPLDLSLKHKVAAKAKAIWLEFLLGLSTAIGMQDSFFAKKLSECTRKGRTDSTFQMLMLKLYSQTNGRLFDELFSRHCATENDSLSEVSNLLNSTLIENGLLALQDGVAREIDHDRLLLGCKTEYEENGYAVFPWKLSKYLIDDLVKAAIEHGPPSFRCRSQDQELPGKHNFVSLPEGTIIALTGINNEYGDSIEYPPIKPIDSFFAVLGRYLMNSKRSYKKHSNIWWTFRSSSASSECAQEFHYDCDSLRWVKFFLYLSDVGPDNGPHVAISKTHRSGSRDESLMHKGYVRHSDQSICSSLLADQKLVTYLGSAGTIIIADTRCWHKGTPVIKDNRVMMDFVYLAHRFMQRIQ